MSEEAITTLLGDGLAPENALVQRWLDEGVTSMRLSPAVETSDIGSKLKVALSSRLDYNGPVLEHLTEVNNSLTSFLCAKNLHGL